MPDADAYVLLVTRNFPPLRGGMERLNHRMLAGLSKYGDVGLVGPEGCADHAPHGAVVIQVPASPLWRFLVGALPAAISLARQRRPRVVLAGSGLTAPLAWLAARLVGAQSVVYVHGLDLIVPNRAYQSLWLPFIRRCAIVIANSRNTARLALERGIDPARLHVIHPGTDLPEHDPGARSRFRHAHGLGDRPLLLSVGRLTDRKGLDVFVREIFPVLLSEDPEVLLLVIGDDATDALVVGSGSARDRVIDAAKSAGVHHALRLMPPCDDATLSAAYRAADVQIFPAREMPGDIEGFGMVAVEAAAHGLPTIAFRSGGTEDAVLDRVTGELVDAADYAGFARAVLDWLPRSRLMDARARCEAAAGRFAWKHFDHKLHALLAATDPPGRS